MIKPQTLESIIVYNYNPISPAPSLSLQMIESVDTEPSTPLGPNQSQTVNSSYQAFVISLTDIRIPNNIQEALQILEWKAMIEEEIRALEKNDTWELGELPK
ncbi:hypothetical protein CK203_067586 [Vitis vinifera]|uniref:Retrovirus-related Pol polyprotein from transposon RE1 n=1 Tax=Vitis vinifera TaxID=29760 RepID=A0A438EBZ1_VITVI|nr:hypothetical protein CK203_067586 [Vitis vinifera]